MMELNMVQETLEKLGEKVETLKYIPLTEKLYKELDTDSLEQVLAKHLPFFDEQERNDAAGQILQGVQEMYDSLGQEVTENWINSQLNGALEKLHSINEKGMYLVNLIRYIMPQDYTPDQRWQQLQNARSFQQQDLDDLTAIAAECLDETGAFLARQEYRAMQDILQKLPQETVELQLNSGPRYATALAASMYITNRQDNAGQTLSPRELGVLAAGNVEASGLLAKCHLHKNRLMALMPQLKELMVKLLVLAVRGFLASIDYEIFACFLSLFIPNSVLLVVLSAALAVLGALLIPQEEILTFLTDVWEFNKSLVNSIINWFRGGKEVEQTVSPVVNTAPVTNHVSVHV